MLSALVLGYWGYTNLPTDFLPDISYPLIKVYVYWTGATPEEINDNIAAPLERTLSTVDNLDYLESSSIEGMYTLLVNFDYGTDVDVAYQDVVAKMGLATRNLPTDVDPPVILKSDPSQLPVVQLIVQSEGRNLVKLRTWVKNILQDQFLAVKGVAGTEIVGGLEREIRVNLDNERLAAYDVSLDEIIKKLKDENIERLAGRVTVPASKQEFILRTTAEFKNVKEISNVIIKNYNGKLIRIKDIATVKDSHEDERVITRFNGVPAIKLNILKQADANTVQVADAVNNLVKKLKTTAPPDIKFNSVENQATYIKGAISGVKDSLIASILLVIIVIYLFLGHWRQVIVMLIALPVTIVFNFFLMKLGGFSINIFSLGGLVVAMGVVLDNSIVVIENITRLQTTGEKDPALQGVNEVSVAILASTLTFLALFLPFLLVPGLTSLLFRELILTIAGIVLISLIVALTVTPMLSNFIVIKGRKHFKKTSFDKFIDRTNQAYRWILIKLLPLRWVVLLIFVLVLVVAFMQYGKVGSEFLPKIDDGRVMIKVILPPGSSVHKTDEMLHNIEQVVKNSKYVDKYFVLSGGKVWGLVTYQIANEGEIDIELVDVNKRPITTKEYIAKLRPQIMKYNIPGAKLIVKQSKTKGIKTTGQSDVEINVKGVELDKIMGLARQVVQKMNQIDGLTNIRIGTQITKPEYQIHVDRTRIANVGLTVQSVSKSMKNLVAGAVATQFRDAGEYYDVRVIVPESKIKTKQDIENMLIDTPSGVKIPLRTVATVVSQVGPVEIVRENQIKEIVVSSDVVKGANVGEMAKIVKEKLSEFNLPEGYEFEFSGQAYMMQQSQNTLTKIILFALFFAYVILAIQFNSFKQPFMILLGVPFSIIGVITALLITGEPVGATVLIGIIIMTGGIATQGVVLISVMNEYKEKGLPLKEAILEAAPLRVRPILMTQATTILGLFPLAINLGSGGDMLQPMAIGVIGGLFFSLFVTLLLLPNLYYILSKKGV